MPIYARKKETEFSPAPEGLWPAVCVDVVDLGIVQTPFGPQEKIQIRWQLEEKDPKTGRRRNLGTFNTRAEAEKHERAVQYFKRHS